MVRALFCVAAMVSAGVPGIAYAGSYDPGTHYFTEDPIPLVSGATDGMGYLDGTVAGLGGGGSSAFYTVVIVAGIVLVVAALNQSPDGSGTGYQGHVPGIDTAGPVVPGGPFVPVTPGNPSLPESPDSLEAEPTSPVPLPATLPLLLGALGLARVLRRRR
ncbi:hypothetical protein [Salipiger sp.]|uniref:hypothetical protein n=1 Tax=Salipiger sp. TaxID=2078585 RepID=UPI003A9817D4